MILILLYFGISKAKGTKMEYLIINGKIRVDISNCNKIELASIIQCLESNNYDVQFKRVVL